MSGSRGTDSSAEAPPGARLIGWIARLVPSVRREDWRSEWLAELQHAHGERVGFGHALWRIRLALNARCSGALTDALWLYRDHGGLRMRRSDLRHALRLLGRQPSFVMAVVLTLGIGIGAATAIFSVVDGLLLRPLPFAEPERLVTVNGMQGDFTSPSLDVEAVAIWREQAGVFEDVRAHTGGTVTLTGRGEPRSYRAELLEPGFLDMLGIRPILGRAFLPEEATPGRDNVVLLGHELWRATFASDPGIVDEAVTLDGEPYTVVGVLPPSLRMLPGGQVHLVLPLADTARSRVALIARLHEQLPLAAAQARLDDVSEVLEAERPRDAGWSVSLSRLGGLRQGAVRQGLLVLSGAVAFLLLIACANAAGLLLVHGAGRQHEFAIRRALGGTRGSLIRQLIAESLGLALLAGALGVVLA
ncbi:MAG: ABC transporter permease, partial [Longimicrobiales bacterium]